MWKPSATRWTASPRPCAPTSPSSTSTPSKDRKKTTYFEHREKNLGVWQELYRRLIAEGRVRQMPVERITDVMSNQLYGRVFTNYFAGRSKPLREQADDLLDVIWNGILTTSEREARRKR